MMDQHEDPKFEAWLKDVARTTYHAPRTTPREEMWARINAARRTRHVIELRPWMRWARYVDLVGGYQSVNFKPEPADPDAIPSQHLFLGASLNLQSVFEDLYGEREERGRSRASHRALHFAAEFVSPPYTTVRMLEADRSQGDM